MRSKSMSQQLDSYQDLVSIIIPVYNTGEYLVECLQSCLDQSYSNIEVLAVDDRSTDQRTIEILKEFASKDSRVKVIWSPQNRGQGYCRNVGVDQCQGKYFAFIDSDDYFKPDFVEKMYHGLEKHHTDFAICDSYNYVDDPTLYDQDNIKVSDSENRFNFEAKDQTIVNNQDLSEMGFLIKFPVSCYGKMFNTQKYKEAGVRFDDGEFSRHCQDEDWSAYTILKLKNFVVLKFVGLNRRMHSNSASSPSRKYYRSSVDAAYRKCQALKNYPFYRLYINSLINNLLLSLYGMSYLTSTYAERLQVIDLAHHYLVKCDSNFNLNPYHYVPIISNQWHNVLSTLDTKPLPVLYLSLRSLHNANWNESYATKQLLENLAAYGILSVAFTALCHSNAVTIQNYGLIEQELYKFAAANNQKLANTQNSAFLEFNDNGVYYHIAKTTPFSTPSALNAQDHLILNEGLSQVVDFYTKQHQPCLFLVSGGDLETQKLCLQLKNKGAKLVYLLNEEYTLHFETLQKQPVKEQGQVSQTQDKAVEPQEQGTVANASASNSHQSTLAESAYIFAPHDFDAVVSLNHYYSQRFTEQYGVQVDTLGYAINPLVIGLNEVERNFITFTNPTLEHGLSIVIKLAESFSKLHPEQKFLIVQDQDHNLQQDLMKIHDASGKGLAHYRQSLQQIVFITDKQVDPIAISRQSKVLLSPSINDNASISNVLECHVNDVPVVFSEQAKYQAVLNSNDLAVPLPESVIKDPTCLPSDAEIAPWVQALETAVNSVTQESHITDKTNITDKSHIADKQIQYQQTMENWMHKLYAVAGIPEVHDHEPQQA